MSAPLVIDGYVRLSRDDNKRSYTSIENQKQIIRQYAQENHMALRHIYEDDGISGYSFDRPQFQEMMAHLDEIQVIVAKDLSRIGRHNARVLLFLEEMEELGKRVILIDDHYDSLSPEDDMLGIKTWDNERHVRSTSRKVKRIKRMEQENGTLIAAPPFGYTRHPLNRKQVLIDPEAAAILQLEKDLYLDGNGFRKTAQLLTDRGVPTPSMLLFQHRQALGLPCGRPAVSRWSFSMVRDTLFNDYHNGTLRTHKRERITINGRDKKVPLEEQYVFSDHHPKIFDDQTWKLLLEVKRSRIRSRYQGQRRHPSLFSGCLYCGDCGRKLTAVTRPGGRKYYLCSTYNKKGKCFCPWAHLIPEEVLVQALLDYLDSWRAILPQALKDLGPEPLNPPDFAPAHPISLLEDRQKALQTQLRLLAEEKLCRLSADPSAAKILRETYDSLLEEKAGQLLECRQRLDCLKSQTAEVPEPGPFSPPPSPLTVFDEILAKRDLKRADVELLTEKIIVERDGSAAIYLRHHFGEQLKGCCPFTQFP